MTSRRANCHRCLMALAIADALLRDSGLEATTLDEYLKKLLNLSLLVS